MLLTFPALAALAATMLYPIAWTIWLSLNGKNFALTRQARFRRSEELRPHRRQRRIPRRALPYAGLRRSRASILEAVIALPVALALASRPPGHPPLPGDRRAAADGRAGGRRARLAMDVRRRLRHDRLDRAAGSAASGPLWFANIWLARATIVIANLWLALPFDILMLVAGLASLPSEPLEAARVDGASPCRC